MEAPIINVGILTRQAITFRFNGTYIQFKRIQHLLFGRALYSAAVPRKAQHVVCEQILVLAPFALARGLCSPARHKEQRRRHRRHHRLRRAAVGGAAQKCR